MKVKKIEKNGDDYCYCICCDPGNESHAVINALVLFTMKAFKGLLNAGGTPVPQSMNEKMIARQLSFPPKEGTRVVSSIRCPDDPQNARRDYSRRIEIDHTGTHCEQNGKKNNGHQFSYHLPDQRKKGTICVMTLVNPMPSMVPAQGLH